MKIDIVILAAGQSRRFGPDNKLLASFGGEPLIAGVVRRMTGVHIHGHETGIVIVTPSADGDVSQALAAAGLSPAVRILPNHRAAEGIGTSVAAGVVGLDADTGAAMFVPGDMPCLSTALVESVVAAFLAHGGQRPAHPVHPDGSQANPVIWPRSCFPSLAALQGDRGAKRLLASAGAVTVPLGDPRAAADIDTPEDLIRLAQSKPI